MADPSLQCPRCAATLRPAVRPGPSGSYRIGAMPVKCPRCDAVVEVRFGDPLPA